MVNTSTRSPPRREPRWEGETDDTIMLSAIEHYSYCPRQCALIHLEQVFDDNQYTTRGRLVHERVDSGVASADDDVRVFRGVPLWSERLRLRGKADLVELRAEGPYPVEYKSGRRHGPHADLQLCAQALCLEEMLGVQVTRGAVYYHASRSRHEVRIDDELRGRTLSVIEDVRLLLAGEGLPPPVSDARCRRCSLREACLPEVVGQQARLRGFQSMLFRVMDE